MSSADMRSKAHFLLVAGLVIRPRLVRSEILGTVVREAGMSIDRP